MTTWRWAGDRALLCTVPGDDLLAANAGARSLAARIRSAADGDVEDVVPGARTVLVLLRPGREPSEALLRSMEAPPGPPADDEGVLHEVGVSYGGDAGPDLPSLASGAGMSEADVVRIHSEPLYTVAFIGFAPGFPYLLGLDARLAAPRLATPRTKIPAGSVGIGGTFTGIYPRATPGGWHLLGRTDATLFDPAGVPPAAMAPGDRVRFLVR